MTEYRPGKCDMCLKDADVRHVNIYINGSEGIYLCHSCYMGLVEIVREKKHASLKKKKEDYKANKVESYENAYSVCPKCYRTGPYLAGGALCPWCAKEETNYICPKCGRLGLPSIYDDTCTKCANKKRGYYESAYDNNS